MTLGAFLGRFVFPLCSLCCFTSYHFLPPQTCPFSSLGFHSRLVWAPGWEGAIQMCRNPVITHFSEHSIVAVHPIHFIHSPFFFIICEKDANVLLDDINGHEDTLWHWCCFSSYDLFVFRSFIYHNTGVLVEGVRHHAGQLSAALHHQIPEAEVLPSQLFQTFLLNFPYVTVSKGMQTYYQRQLHQTLWSLFLLLLDVSSTKNEHPDIIYSP